VAESESGEFDCDASFGGRSNTADDLLADERWRIAEFRCFYSCIPGLAGVLHYGQDNASMRNLLAPVLTSISVD
jgi:hypothetical protein